MRVCKKNLQKEGEAKMKKRFTYSNHVLKNQLINFSSNQLKKSSTPDMGAAIFFHEVSLTPELKAIQNRIKKQEIDN